MNFSLSLLMKWKIYDTVGTVPKYHTKNVDTKANSIPLTHIYTGLYMTTQYPGLEKALQY